MSALSSFRNLFSERKDLSLNQLLDQIRIAHQTVSGVTVTPANCMRAPTVQAIVNAVSRRLAISPVHVYQKSEKDGRTYNERQPNHPVAKLLSRPNEWQTHSDYWLDAASTLVRYGRFHAWKGRGSTGPIRRLVPLDPGAVDIKQNAETLDVEFEIKQQNGHVRQLGFSEMHYARSTARDFLRGDSPVHDVRESIALEIAVETFGASFFGNGGLPLVFFQFLEGHQGFKDKAAEDAFVNSFQEAFSGRKRFRGMLVPKGMKPEFQIQDNEKTQLNETRKFLRTVIAGAFGVPPHLVGDLERATFNNVEQQDSDFVINVILPYAQMFEAAMERDLLTDADRRQGIVIRFNLDAVQRADFKSRQEGLNIQRAAGIINANEWREREKMNPISEEDGGEDYLVPMNMKVPGEEPPPPEPPAPPPDPNAPPTENDPDAP